MHSASVVVAEAVSGSHVLKVQGYSLIKGLGVGKFIGSVKFNAGGRSWCIRCYPDGWGSECTDWISVALFLLNPDATEVKAKYRFSLLDQAERTHVPLHTEAVSTFSAKASGKGHDKFIKRQKLEQSAYLKDDCLEISCDVTVLKEICLAKDVAVQFVVVPQSDIHQHLGALLSDAGSEGADVSFEVGGETFAAHRCVLAARSSVFKSGLFGPMKEKTATSVKIDDMDPRVFKAMLHFIYTDSLPQMDSADATMMAQHLLAAADRYSLARLKLICEHELCSNIDKSTVTTTLALADQHGCHGLKEACFSFLKSPGNLKEITASDDLEHLMKSCPSVLKELVAQLAP